MNGVTLEFRFDTGETANKNQFRNYMRKIENEFIKRCCDGDIKTGLIIRKQCKLSATIELE